MNLLEKLFGKTSKSKKENRPQEERGKYMPPPETPTDDKFTLNFKENGGKFLYCLDNDDIKNTFDQIIEENDWSEGNAYCRDERLRTLFSDAQIKFSDNLESSFCLLSCEYLVANTGAILFSSNQIGEKKMSQLPDNFVVMAGTSQLIETLGEGLRRIKARRENLPSNITTIKNFSESTDPKGHFMSYGSVSKNLYLLLLEDL